MKATMARVLAALAVSFAGGCAEVGEELGLASLAADNRPDDGLWDNQSQPLLGTLDPALDSARVKLPFGVSAQPTGHGLNVPISAPYLPLVATTASGASVNLRVREAGPDDALRMLYDVKVVSSEGEESEYCADAGPAYAIPGSFGDKGVYARLTDSMFACTFGAASKGIIWEYPPSLAYGSYYQAAVRLARADFCMAGVANTFTGTPVLVGDPEGHYLTRPETGHGDLPAGPFYFEAAWAAGSGPNVKNVKSKVFCVSKWRYQALRPAACTIVLPEPRGGDINSGFCEKYGDDDDSEEELLDKIAAAAALEGLKVVFSFSGHYERGLWEYKRAGAAQWVASVRDYDGYGTPEEFPAEFAAVDPAFPRFIGTILRHERPGETKPLFLYGTPLANYRTTSDPSLASPACPVGDWACWLTRYTQLRTVGHVFKTWEPGRVPLYSYRSGSQYRIFTWIGSDTPPDGWTYAGFEGYALRSARTN